VLAFFHLLLHHLPPADPATGARPAGDGRKVSEGDLNIRSDISTGDEFQQLSRDVLTAVMLANLKDNAGRPGGASNKSHGPPPRTTGRETKTSGCNESNRLKKGEFPRQL